MSIKGNFKLKIIFGLDEITAHVFQEWAGPSVTLFK